MDIFTKAWERIQSRWTALPDSQRPTVVGALLLMTLALLGVVMFVSQSPMVPLNRQPESAKDQAALLKDLRAKDYKVEVERGTNALLVKASERGQIEVEFGSYLKNNDSGGFSYEEKSGFVGRTQFQEHTQYVHDLSGEIEKLLNRYNAVAGSKVILSIQQSKLFKPDQIDPSASVLLELEPGMSLTTAEGDRMARQVAGAVLGLRPERVQILDENMRVLHADIDTQGEEGGTGLAALQREWEGYYQSKVESLLLEMFGPGNASVRVSVDLDHSQRSTYQRALDADNVVTVASKASEQSTEGPAFASGAPGTDSNLGGGEKKESGAVSTQSSEALNIDVPETKKTDVTAPGRILTVSAAVAVRGTYGPATAVAAEGAEGGPPVTTPAAAVYTPRTEKELADITALVRSALGPHAMEVSVKDHEFPRFDLKGGEVPLMSRFNSDDAATAARYSLVLFVFLFMYGMVLRPMVQSLAVSAAADEETVQAVTISGAAELPPHEFSQPDFDVQGWLDRFSSGDRFVSRADVSRLVLADVAHSVVTLQEWLSEESNA